MLLSQGPSRLPDQATLIVLSVDSPDVNWLESGQALNSQGPSRLPDQATLNEPTTLRVQPAIALATSGAQPDA